MTLEYLSKIVAEYGNMRTPILEQLAPRGFNLPGLAPVFNCKPPIDVTAAALRGVPVRPGEAIVLSAETPEIVWCEAPADDGPDVMDIMRQHRALLDAEETKRKMPRIAVCVCTRGRPLMFGECLESLLLQKVPAGCRMEVIVVDNNAHRASAYDVVADVCRRISSNTWVTFVHEPHPGISQARNAALDEALARGADWIAFIDDDEVAGPEWLVELYGALFTFGDRIIRHVPETPPSKHPMYSCERIDWRPADAAHGVIDYEFPADAPDWRCRNPWGDWGDVNGLELGSAGTGNVIFRASIVKEAGLRFDEALGLKGGEDTDFFKRFHNNGGRIILALHAVVTETVPWERITVKGHARKAFRSGVYKVEAAREMGRIRRLRWARRALKRSLGGLLAIVAAAPLAVFSGRGKRLMLSGARKMAEGLGMMTALLGGSFEYYKTTTGY